LGASGASGASEGSRAASVGALAADSVAGPSGTAALVAGGGSAGGSCASGGAAAAAAAGLVGSGRRRIEKRVIASTKARPRAARPMSDAPTTEAPSGRAVLFATWRPFTYVEPLGLGDGVRVGNRFPALPPGLSEGLMVAAGTSGRLPTGSGEVVGIGVAVVAGVAGVPGVAVPEIRTVADAFGSLGSLAALPITVSLTDVTADAVTGTFDSASSCRCTDFASIAPRSHDVVPSLLPQPKLNFAAALAGDTCRRTIASGMFPPVVQALTTH
jgi:hypothetical protein